MVTTHDQQSTTHSLLKTVRQVPLQLTSRTLSKAAEISESYGDVKDGDKAMFWAKSGTLGAFLGLLVGIAPGMPKEVKPYQAIVGYAVSRTCLEGTKKHTKAAVKAKELKRLEQVEKHERDKLNIVTTYRPYDAPNMIKVGGEARAVANVLNTDPHSLQVEAFGEKVWGTYKRFYFGIIYKDDRADLFSWKDMIRETLATTETISVNLEEGRLCVDVSKPQYECTYPKVREHIGTDRHQVLIPLGMSGDRLLFVPLDSSFNGGWATGMSGSGKTQWALSTLDFLRRRHSNKVVQYSVCELVQGTKVSGFNAADWSDDPHLFCPMSQGYVGLILAMAKMIYECRRRAKLFDQHSVQNLDEYNALGLETLPYMVLIVDEPENAVDEQVCPSKLYLITILRQFLEIGRKCRSQGGSLIFLPKSVAAGEKDIFPVGLRRTMGSLAICLKALSSDGCITLQATEKEEGFAGAVAHLPGRGAGLTRHNGEITRIQSLHADKLEKTAIVGYGRDPQPDQSLPPLTQVIADFCAGGMTDDPDLDAALKAEEIDMDTLWAIAKGELTPAQAREGKKPKPKPEKADKPPVDYESQRRTYEIYKQLRTSGKDGKALSMSNALVEMTGGANYSSKQYKTATAAVHAAVAVFGTEWIASLPQTLSDEAMTEAVFGRGKDQKLWNDRISIIRKLRAKLSQQANASSN